MKALLINGSPHPKGCTYTALEELARTLEAEGIEPRSCRPAAESSAAVPAAAPAASWESACTTTR